jgi:N-acetyl-anhydromuramoyl-L-alanine amidase
MNIINHRLDNATQVLTPNCDNRPDESDISLCVIHCISLPPGKFGTPYIRQFFCNQLNPDEHNYFESIAQLKVSAHLVISRSGIITQYVPFNKRAWHAGQSEYQGRTHCNDFSIGIELEGTETTDFTDKQYRQLATIISCLQIHYPKITTKSITGHSDIAPGRKNDPGTLFDWEKLYRLFSE